MLLASDYDGTLLRGGEITDADRAAMNAFRAAGHLFGIVTGRGYCSIREELGRHGLSVDFLICNNGSALYDGEDHCLEETFAPADLLPDLVTCIDRLGGRRAAINCSRRRLCVRLGEDREACRPDVIAFEEILTYFTRFNQVDTAAPDDEGGMDLAQAIQARFGDRLYAHNNGVNVDIVKKGVSKPAGLSRYLALTGHAPGDLVTVGDNLNDLEMLQAFRGYVMADGRPQVIRAVGRTCESVADLIGRIMAG